MKPAGEACNQCPLKDNKIVRPEKARLPVRLAIVGESPGTTELQKGRPFVGMSGQLLKTQLQRNGIRRGECHITNAVLCELKDKKKELEPARKCCAKRLRDELESVAAPMVATLGGPALHSTLNLKTAPSMVGSPKGRKPQWRGTIQSPTAAMHQDRGERIWTPADALVAPVLHPAFVLRSNKWAPLFEHDWDRIGRVMQDGWEPPELHRKMYVAQTHDEVLGRLALLEQRHEIGFDVETNFGPGALDNRLVCFTLSDGDTSLVVPWTKDLEGLEPWWSPTDLPRVQAMLNQFFYHHLLVTHNGPQFDHLVAARHGLFVKEWADTMVASHALESHLPRSLIRVVTTYLDVANWKAWDHGVDLRDLWPYNMRDALYTILAWQPLKERLQ